MELGPKEINDNVEKELNHSPHGPAFNEAKPKGNAVDDFLTKLISPSSGEEGRPRSAEEAKKILNAFFKNLRVPDSVSNSENQRYGNQLADEYIKKHFPSPPKESNPPPYVPAFNKVKPEDIKDNTSAEKPPQEPSTYCGLTPGFLK